MWWFWLAIGVVLLIYGLMCAASSSNLLYPGSRAFAGAVLILAMIVLIAKVL